MERIKNIFILLFISVLVVSCSVESQIREAISPTYGHMKIEVTKPAADKHDYIHKIRFIVFNNASTFPQLDINEVASLNEEDQSATEFRTLLNVTQNNDKMLIVIINEPDNLIPVLDQITHPNNVEDIMFDLADAFDPSLTTPASTGIPMSGVKRGISVTEDNETEETAEQISITVERSVGRIELWLKTEPGITAEVNNDAQITLRKNHDKGYLATGTEQDGTRFQTEENKKNNFGHMLEVTNPQEEVIWNHTGDTPITISSTPSRVVIFYTPERICDEPDDTNKPILEIFRINTSEGFRNAQNVLKEFAPEGSSALEPLTAIKRNNIYRIVGVITSKTIEFSNMVEEWTEENIEID